MVWNTIVTQHKRDKLILTESFDIILSTGPKKLTLMQNKFFNQQIYSTKEIDIGISVSLY